MRLIEDKISYVDSVNFEILAQLVMVENKIVTLANSFTEMYDLKAANHLPRLAQRLVQLNTKKHILTHYLPIKTVIITKQSMAFLV